MHPYIAYTDASCVSISRLHAAIALPPGSMHSLVASPYKSAYNAAKHGIAGFTKTVALETAQARCQSTSATLYIEPLCNEG